MNTTATKRIAFATLAAPVLAAIGIGLAGAAAAETPATAPEPGSAENSAQQTVEQLREQGLQVDINSNGHAPLNKCSIIATRQDRHRHHGGAHEEQYNAAHVDALCPSVG